MSHRPGNSTETDEVRQPASDQPGSSNGSPEAAPNYDAPALECDVVMKGGITSGIVYPGAVTALATRYRFRSIGGASAGAIAAAVVAAAEYARQRRTDAGAPNPGQSFDKVTTLPNEIGRVVDGKPFLLQLFQPDTATRPLFNVAIAFLRDGLFGGAWMTLRSFWRFPLLALAIAATSIALTVFAGARDVFAAAGVAAAVAVLLVGLGADLLHAISSLAKNDYGLCRLGPEVGSEATPSLTSWLHGLLQEIAGREDGPALSFADLWGVPELSATPTDEDREARNKRLLELSRTPQDRTVDLQMMTTNLTHGRPARLPIPIQQHHERLEEYGGLLFDPEELDQFFPADVVQHLQLHAPPFREETAGFLEQHGEGRTFFRFPAGGNLPVVVATRMSLSFPILIAAIPLWEIDYGAIGGSRLKRVYFSDGGITSNFPVHFFDAPLPARPTFGLHLAAFEPGEAADRNDPRKSIGDPAPVAGQARDAGVEFNSLLGFLTAIKDAAQNWRDNAQARLPGFRERVIHIKLGAGEGGLNLAMKSDKISELTERGRYAGDRLVTLFSGPNPQPEPTARWDDHRFARYRTTMSLLERYLRVLKRGYEMPPDSITTPYAEQIKTGESACHYAFSSAKLRGAAQTTTANYLHLVEVWEGQRRELCEEPPKAGQKQTLDDENVPRPPSVLRAVPPV